MPDGIELDENGLLDDLRGYLALSSAVEMPEAVRAMSAATLGGASRGVTRRLLPAGALVAASAVAVAAAVVVALSRTGPTPDRQASSAFSAAGGAAAGSGVAAGVQYPGIDAASLQATGHTRLLSPAGHGSARIGPDAARAAAIATAAKAAAAGTAPGVAVLAWVEDRSASPITCLCWVVGVPASAAGSVPPGHLQLVYIDAVSGVVAGAHTGAGT